MKFISKQDANRKNLIQLTLDLRDDETEREYLMRCYKQVMVNKGRKAEYVKDWDGKISLFVDDAARRDEINRGTPLSELLDDI